MQSLVTPGAAITVIPAIVSVRIDLLVVGEELRISLGAVDPMSVVLDGVRSGRDPDDGPPARLQKAPGPGHGNQVAPWVKLVTISTKNEALIINCKINSL